MAGLRAAPAGVPAGHTKATSASYYFHEQPQRQTLHTLPMSMVKSQGPEEQPPGMGTLAARPWIKARTGTQTGLLTLAHGS